MSVLNRTFFQELSTKHSHVSKREYKLTYNKDTNGSNLIINDMFSPFLLKVANFIKFLMGDS